MIEKKPSHPSSPEDYVSSTPETTTMPQIKDLMSEEASEVDHSSYKFLQEPKLVTRRNMQGLDHTEQSDGGTSSSASTLSTSSIGRRSKSKDSRHSSDEVIGEEDSDVELSDDNRCVCVEDVRVQASIFESEREKETRIDKNIPEIGVITSSDVDSAFEDLPLVGRGHRNKKRVKQKKSTRGYIKSNKPAKYVYESGIPQDQRPSRYKENIEGKLPLILDKYSNEPENNNRSFEIALFNLEVSPVQDSPLMMENMNEILLYDPHPHHYPANNNTDIIYDDCILYGQNQMEETSTSLDGLQLDEEQNFMKKLKKDVVVLEDDVDSHQPELHFLLHLEEDKIEVDGTNPTLPFMSVEITNAHDIDVCSPQQEPNQKSSEHECIEIKTDKVIEYDVDWVPPDGGWGWMVLFGSIIVNILIPGTVKSFGVLFIEFLEVFKATPAAASWIPALSYWLYSSTGPFATALAIKYSHRGVTIAGGILAAAGLMLSYFATSIEYLYVSYGLIGGLGAGLAYPIGVMMVGQYFRKRIGLANGLCTSGSALGSVVMPPLLRYLLVEYDYRGAILIMGAILLNVCVAAMFYDPVEKHLKKVFTPREIQIPQVGAAANVNGVGAFSVSRGRSPATNNVDIGKQGQGPFIREMAMSMPIAIPLPNLNEARDVRDRRGSGSIKKATFQIGNETPTADSWSLRSTEGTSPLGARLLKDDPGSPRMYHNSNLRTRPFPCSLESTSEMENLFNTHLNVSSGGAASTHASNAASRSKLNLTAIPEDDDQPTSECGSRNLEDWSYYRNLTPTKQRIMRLTTGAGNQVVSSNSQPHNMNNSAGRTGLSRTLSVASNVSNSSFHYVSTIHHGSLLMTMQYDKSMPDFASTLTLKSVRQSCWSCWIDLPKRLLRKCGLCPRWSADKIDHQTRVSKKGPDSWKKFIDLSLLKDGIFIVILLSSATTAIGYTNFIILLPSYAISIGFDKSDASLLLSIVAAFDFVGRIGGAALSDLIVMQRKWFYIVGLLGSGIALALLPLTNSYWPMVSFISMFGLTSGIYIGVTAVILADILGIDRLGSSYGITLFLNGIVQLVGPPICGALLEYFKSYVHIFVGLGLTLVIGAALWIFVPFIERHRRLHAEMEECMIELNGINPEEKQSQLQHMAVRRLKEAEAV